MRTKFARKNVHWDTRLMLSAAFAAAVPASVATATSLGYSGFVTQFPAIYASPPDPNVMFTLDDSGSMLSDMIPDVALADQANMVVDVPSTVIIDFKARFPVLWWESTSGNEVLSSYLTPEYYNQNSDNPKRAVARYLRSAAGNPLYYNPVVTYKPWPDPNNDQQRLPNADPTAVKLQYFSPTLARRYKYLDISRRMPSTSIGADNDYENFWPATYFVYTGSATLPPGKPSSTESVNGTFTRVQIKPSVTSYAKAATRTDCAGSTCTYAEELQNFANWLQYYRNRFLAAKGGIGEAFSKQSTNLRVGFASLNAASVIRRDLRPFSGSYRTQFYNSIYSIDQVGSTPLRAAADTVGRYFQRTGPGNPYSQDLTNSLSAGTEYECRRSFHVLSTDGYWNGAGASAPANANNDNFSGQTPAKPDGTTYTYSDTAVSASDPLVSRFTISPFQDTYSDTLADVMAYYWKTDLRPDLANRVPPSRRDPAFWQHLTTYTIGIGVEGSGLVTTASGGAADISSQAARDDLVKNKVPLRWTQPSGETPKTIDDLIHSSMSARGRHFGASNATQLATSLASALAEATDQTLEMGSLAAQTTATLSVAGRIYQPSFNPNRWEGRLYAFDQAAGTGAVNTRPTDSGYTNSTQAWEASNAMPSPGQRNIFTSDGGASSGKSFVWGSLTASQQAALGNDSNILSYLRGDGSREIQSGGTLRDRSRYTIGAVTGGVLGDIVNGSPVKGPDAGGGYDRLPAGSAGQSTYASFRSGTGLDNMRNTMYLGANDGMAHAFNLANGVERFAYVPNSVFSVARSSSAGDTEQKLRMLSDPAYTHRFTVDGPPNISDAYIGGAWKSVLVASTGAGARSVFAMDVTDPDVASGFSASSVMWEFSEENSADMGFVLGYPHVARMRDGTWAAIFGNGYDSTNGQAKLYVLNVATGRVLKEFAVGAPGNNGLSQPNFVLNSSREVIAIYAGDIKGNLWKFDVSSTRVSDWTVAFGSAPYYDPLFSTALTNGTAQPISVMPEITAHPQGGAMVLFGTGKLFESSDTSSSASANTNLATQTFYGIWDKPSEGAITATSRASVFKQHIAGAIVLPATYATTSSGEPDWSSRRGWYVDLQSGGERVNVAPQIVNGMLFFVANTPVVDPCSSGGSARVIAVNPVSGSAPAFPVFLSGNAMLNASGILTSPILQYKSNASVGTGVSVAPRVVDVGQTSGARAGGVELGRRGSGPCNALMSAGASNANLLSSWVKLCTDKPHVSWRQIK